jgi:ribonuclease HI
VEPDYEQVVALSAQAQSDLNWVIHNIVQRNGKTFGESNIDIVIHSDASLSGWGAVCKGQSANGSWSVTESTNHINYLELLAAFHGLQCFVSTERSVHVRVGIDNSTAVAYLNNMGGTKSPSLNGLSRTLWEWCISRSLQVTAQHVPGTANVIADQLSRTIDNHLEWSLNDEIYQSVICRMDFAPDIDLFASRLNAKTNKFVSWHPEPGAVTYDAFTMSWANVQCYAFPPFSLLPRVLAKILKDQAMVLLIAPVWPTQTWYPLLLRLLADVPFLLPRSERLPHDQRQLHPLRDTLELAGWKLSGKPSQQEAFLRSRLPSSVDPGQLVPRSNTREFGRNGLAGVVKDRLVYFNRL